MASEIRVDKINSLSGVGTVTLSPTGVDISGITTAATLKATTGIVTTLTATTGIVTTLTTNTLTANSTTKVGSGVTLSPDGDIFVTGVTTSTTVQVGGGVTISESGIEASGIGITCANINGNQIGGRRNFVINGEARVAQRGTITDHGTSAKYTAVDRFKTRIGASYNFDVTSSQSTDAPVGFSHSLKLSPDSTSTPSGSSNGAVGMILEGSDLQGFGFGTSSAKPMTLSFYAKSGSAGAGTYSIDIHYVADGGAAKQQTRAFTITSSWQRFIFTFEANGTSTSDAIRNTKSEGLRIFWHLASGPDDLTSAITTWTATSSMKTVTGMDNFMSSTSNEFYITGVQLEIGSQATAFEHRTLGDELSLCQRYFYMAASGADSNSATAALCLNYTASSARAVFHFPTTMRTTPDIYSVEGTNYFRILQAGGTSDNPDEIHGGNERPNMAEMAFEDDVSGLTVGQASLLRLNAADARIGYEAEL